MNTDQNRLNKVDLVIGKCPYCKNYVDLKTGERVLREPDGMVTVRVCTPCRYIEMAVIQAELKEMKDEIQIMELHNGQRRRRLDLLYWNEIYTKEPFTTNMVRSYPGRGVIDFIQRNFKEKKMNQEEIKRWNEALEKTIKRYEGYLEIKNVDELLGEWEKNSKAISCFLCRIADQHCIKCVWYKYNHHGSCFRHLGYQLLEAFSSGDFCTDDAEGIVEMCLENIIDELRRCQAWFNQELKNEICLVATTQLEYIYTLVEIAYGCAVRLERSIIIDFRGARAIQEIGDHDWRLPETIYVDPNCKLSEIKDALKILYNINSKDGIICQ